MGEFKNFNSFYEVSITSIPKQGKVGMRNKNDRLIADMNIYFLKPAEVILKN